MYNKKLTAFLFVSICVFSRANGMEWCKEVVTHKVIPAGLIMATGAALGIASNVAFNAIDKSCRKNDIFMGSRPSLIESAVVGGLLGCIPLAAKLNFSEVYTKIDLSKLALIGVAPFAFYTGLAVWANKHQEDNLRRNPAEATEAAQSQISNNNDPHLSGQLQVVQLFSLATTVVGLKALLCLNSLGLL